VLTEHPRSRVKKRGGGNELQGPLHSPLTSVSKLSEMKGKHLKKVTKPFVGKTSQETNNHEMFSFCTVVEARSSRLLPKLGKPFCFSCSTVQASSQIMAFNLSIQLLLESGSQARKSHSPAEVCLEDSRKIREAFDCLSVPSSRYLDISQ
jgi:hypothetical protein